MKRWIVMMLMLVGSFTIEAGPCKSYNVSKETLVQYTAEIIPVIFQKNQQHWTQLLLGTLASETGMGSFKGNSKHGVTQITPIALKEIKRVVSKELKQQIREQLQIDLDRTAFGTLEWDHRVSILCTALFYKITTKKAPTNLQEYAHTWKTYYNTHLGSGTVQGFIKHYSNYVDRTVLLRFQKPIDYRYQKKEFFPDLRVFREVNPLHRCYQTIQRWDSSVRTEFAMKQLILAPEPIILAVRTPSLFQIRQESERSIRKEMRASVRRFLWKLVPTIFQNQNRHYIVWEKTYIIPNQG